MIYEIFGYAASLLVAISLMMSSILKLRVINLIGAACFATYGLIIKAYPVAGMNAFIVAIDIYYLMEMLRQKEYFTILEIRPDSKYLQHFLEFYHEEISKFFPDTEIATSEKQLVFFVLRNMVPTGLFIAEPCDKDSLCTVLDFVIPGYRDYKIGKFIFSKSAHLFLSKGYHTLYSPPGSPAHQSYLRRMGFHQPSSGDADTPYVKSLE